MALPLEELNKKNYTSYWDSTKSNTDLYSVCDSSGCKFRVVSPVTSPLAPIFMPTCDRTQGKYYTIEESVGFLKTNPSNLAKDPNFRFDLSDPNHTFSIKTSTRAGPSIATGNIVSKFQNFVATVAVRDNDSTKKLTNDLLFALLAGNPTLIEEIEFTGFSTQHDTTSSKTKNPYFDSTSNRFGPIMTSKNILKVNQPFVTPIVYKWGDLIASRVSDKGLSLIINDKHTSRWFNQMSGSKLEDSRCHSG